MIVSNSSPLIALAKVRLLSLLKELYGKVLIPKTVYEEVVLTGRGRLGAREVGKALDEGWIETRSALPDPILADLLGRGEAEAVTLAKQLNLPLLIDDSKGFIMAKTLRIQVTGTIGILVKAYQSGLTKDLKQVLDDLRNKGFWISDKLYNEILRRYARKGLQPAKNDE